MSAGNRIVLQVSFLVDLVWSLLEKSVANANVVDAAVLVLGMLHDQISRHEAVVVCS